jgi:DHA1 family multidrug resistance protein-like MFS transporter
LPDLTPATRAIAAAVDWRRNLRAGMAIILPFLPLLVRSLGVGDPAHVQIWSGAIFAAPFLFAALMTPIWGWIGDRFGRKPMVVRALLGLSLSLFLMSFARSPQQLLLLRVLQGLVSGFVPAAIALVSATAPRQHQGYALSTLSSAQAGGVVAGPLIGGFLADVLDYRALFYVTGAIELVAALMVIGLVREGRRPRQGHRRNSLALNARFALRPPLPTVLVALCLTQLGLLVVQPFFALYVEALGVSTERLSSTTGLLFGITGLAMLVAGPQWGRLSDRIGKRRALTIAFVSGSVLFFLQGSVTSVRWLFVLRLLQGVAAAGMLPSLYAVIAAATPGRVRGGVMGFGSSATLLGGMFGPLLGGVLAAAIGMRATFGVAGLLFLVNLLCALRLPRDAMPRPPRARRSWELSGT